MNCQQRALLVHLARVYRQYTTGEGYGAAVRPGQEPGEAPYVSGRGNPRCRYCQRSFYNTSSLRRHMQRHLDKNRIRYPCPVCAKQFARKDYVREHCINVHGTDG
ncbi:hypothetical protein IscW_ISCW016355 [Ixodes scapularis]|uniref:C2H2-type domain-containing protein n=1 Tax=Ixodes scapularis TaxID=6945 RepID=B7P2G1_IXOSC|nr:hypothetical protein IscW_ISCW016355 [Ixodes scapularis]|eukprot:XP_002402335.1 hypothetical protein IscW_ISCW016355 [Ixodes scapularis]